MSDMNRMREDPTIPPALRSALRDAGAETAPQKVVKEALGAAGVGAGTAWLTAHAAGKTAPLASALFGGSLLVKGSVAVAIFVAGSLVGGYTVHRHDRQALASERALASREATPERPAVVRDDAPTASAVAQSVPPPGQVAPTSAPVAQVAPTSALVAPGPSQSMPVVALPASVPAVASAPEAPDALVGPTVAPATEALRRQFESLRAIRDAVDADQPVPALASITAHRARFPDTPFDQELLLLEARARWAQHDRTACDAIARFTSAYSKSLLLRRVEALRAQAGCLDAPKRRSP